VRHGPQGCNGRCVDSLMRPALAAAAIAAIALLTAPLASGDQTGPD
jgi:hypothetical protein